MKTTTTTEAATNFKIREWRPFEKNTLRGFLSLELPSGMILHGCTLNQKGESRWIGLPAKEYLKGSERAWSPLIEFTDRDVRESFQALALEAIDEYLQEERE
jgi:hypothetical protein